MKIYAVIFVLVVSLVAILFIAYCIANLLKELNDKDYRDYDEED